jgi:hypothetical protein
LWRCHGSVRWLRWMGWCIEGGYWKEEDWWEWWLRGVFGMRRIRDVYLLKGLDQGSE